jgi:phosphonate transport system substrate-binding protein
MRVLSLVFVCLTLAGCGGQPDEGEIVFRFSAIPDEKPTENEVRFAPVAEYLAEKLGVKVEYKAVTNYSGSVQAFKNGDIDAAWFGGLSGVQARLAVKGSEAIAQGAEDPNFYSYFIAHKDSGLKPGDARLRGDSCRNSSSASRPARSRRSSSAKSASRRTIRAPLPR